jgi:hypothetical protein
MKSIKEIFKERKRAVEKEIRTALMIYSRDYNRFVRYLNECFLCFDEEYNEKGKRIGSSLVITYGGPTFYILYSYGNFYWVFSWGGETYTRKIRTDSRFEKELFELFNILEHEDIFNQDY